MVSLKGKTRSVFLVKELQKKLLRYAAEQGIKSGLIFITLTGKPRIRIYRRATPTAGSAPDIRDTVQTVP